MVQNTNTGEKTSYLFLCGKEMNDEFCQFMLTVFGSFSVSLLLYNHLSNQVFQNLIFFVDFFKFTG